MIRLGHRPKRPEREPVIPLINVVFLLLIFVLLTAVFEPLDPFPLDLPRGHGSNEASDALTVAIAEDGRMAVQGQLIGVQALINQLSEGQRVLLRADADARAADIVALASRLHRARGGQIDMAIETPAGPQ